MRILGIVALGAAAVFGCAASPSARAGAEEDHAIAAFEGACLDNLSNPARAAQLATAGGLIEVPEPQRSILLDGKLGRVWFSNASGARQFLKLADNGVCSISAPYADDRATLELFKKHSRNRLSDDGAERDCRADTSQGHAGDPDDEGRARRLDAGAVG
jgi:hypothetical protein